MNEMSISYLAIGTLLLCTVLHEVGHYLAYKIYGFNNTKVLWKKLCVVIDTGDFTQKSVLFFRRKKEKAWIAQIIISLSGLIFNVFLAIGWSLLYILTKDQLKDSYDRTLFLVICAYYYTLVIVNCIPETSDGKKIMYAFRHKENYPNFYEEEYVLKPQVIKKAEEIESYLNG